MSELRAEVVDMDKSLWKNKRGCDKGWESGGATAAARNRVGAHVAVAAQPINKKLLMTLEGETKMQRVFLSHSFSPFPSAPPVTIPSPLPALQGAFRG